MTNTPLISIIIPVYNVEKYLNRCLNSVINQTYNKLEIILVNDGSTDNSLRICQKYKQTDSRILILNQKNKGLSGARNSGLDIASGEYIGFVDSDDWIELNMFELMLQTMIQQEVGIVECSLLRTLEVDNTIIRAGETIVEDRETSLNRIISNQHFSVWRRLYKKELLNNIRFVEGKNSEDVYFTISVFQKVRKIAYMKIDLYNYFIGGQSITRGGYRLKTLDSIDAAIFLEKKINIKEISKELKLISTKFLLIILLYNYKQLFINNEIDSDLSHRKKIKVLINKHYKFSLKNNQALLARILPLNIFGFILNLYSKNNG